MITIRKFWLRAAAVSLWVSGASIGFAEESYWLGPQDKIRINIHEYPNISGEVIVGPSGEIGIPLIGNLQARGLSTKELGDLVGRKLREVEKLSENPSVTVQITEFRPFYVAGNVEKPGRYAYEPGMTVIKAVSTAGGLFRLADSDVIRLGRDATNAEGLMKTLKIVRSQLRFRIERLQAELDERGNYTAGKQVSGAENEMGQHFREREQLLFDARAKLISGQTDALTKLGKVYQAEVISLRKRVELKRIEIDTAQKDLDRIKRLAGMGATASSQALESERVVADLRGEEEELSTQVLRAEQGITQTEQSLRSLVDGRKRDIVQELHSTEVELRETEEKIRTQELLLNEALVLAPALYDQMYSNLEARMSYRIIRSNEKGTIEIPASESDIVQAGDVVKVFALIETN